MSTPLRGGDGDAAGLMGNTDDCVVGEAEDRETDGRTEQNPTKNKAVLMAVSRGGWDSHSYPHIPRGTGT